MAQDQYAYTIPAPSNVDWTDLRAAFRMDRTFSMIEHSDEVVEDLYSLIYGYPQPPGQSIGPDIAIFHQTEGTSASDLSDRVLHHLQGSDGPHILLCQMRLPDPALRTPVMRLIAFNREACYHSSVTNLRPEELDPPTIFEITCNLCGDRKRNTEGVSHHVHYSNHLHFKYNIQNGRTAYVIYRADEDLSYNYQRPPNPRSSPPVPMHPFALHLVFIFKGVLNRSVELDDTFHRLELLERSLLVETPRVTAGTAQDNKVLLQKLHHLFREMIVGGNVTKRDSELVTYLQRDLARVQKLVHTTPGAHPLDETSHQRIADAFLCLQSLCVSREGFLAKRLQRVQNLVGLTYNLMANQDSITSQKIAIESTNIAHDARQDSYAMKAIALLTMFFLPATFISSLLGTNLLALNTSGNGKAKLIVSDHWWIFLVAAVPLTLFTLLAWWSYLRWLPVTPRTKRLRRGSANHRDSFQMQGIDPMDDGFNFHAQ